MRENRRNHKMIVASWSTHKKESVVLKTELNKYEADSRKANDCSRKELKAENRLNCQPTCSRPNDCSEEDWQGGGGGGRRSVLKVEKSEEDDGFFL